MGDRISKEIGNFLDWFSKSGYAMEDCITCKSDIIKDYLEESVKE